MCYCTYLLGTSITCLVCIALKNERPSGVQSFIHLYHQQYYIKTLYIIISLDSNMVKYSAFAATLALMVAPSAAFAPAPLSTKASTELLMAKNNDVSKAIGSSMVAASLLLSSVLTPDAAIAASSSFDVGADFGPTSSLISARSGGRGGGRSSASSMRAPPPRPSQSSTTINRTTVIQAAPAPSVIVAPSPVMMGGGFGYSPFTPSPLGVGLGIAGEVGREMREYRQEDQIRQARSEAEQAKQRNFALEQRLSNMEMQQNAQNAANAAAAAAASYPR
jgi:hypothetical protein